LSHPDPEWIAEARGLAGALLREQPYGLDRLVHACDSFITKYDPAFDFLRITESRRSPLAQLREDMADAKLSRPALEESARSYWGSGADTLDRAK
jgi:hypothetical protein